ncbi:MAG: hypothetical protein KGI36_12185, partial [Burkholderiales bacterium]|nr:hypothetical protein [Burkholderiales bacterium]
MNAAGTAAALQYCVVEGPSNNLMLRDGDVCAQCLLTDGPAPRLLFAFAAGNSGAAIWFEPAELHWQALAPLRAQRLADGQGRPLRGVEIEVRADRPRLRIRRALLGSVRVLRNHQHDASLPPAGLVDPQLVRALGGAVIVWQRDRIDGRAGYRLELQVVGGRVEADAEALELIAAPGEDLQLRLVAATGETPLRPLPAAQLLTAAAADLPQARQALEFLSFDDRWLAGGWRFLTYFGRDTLMSLRLLLPVLQPAGMRAALASVLERLDAQGRVAHEENVGEFPLIERVGAGWPLAGAPEFELDHKMVDDDFMLLPVLAACLLEAGGRFDAASFLATRSAGGVSYGALIMRNAAHVLARARPFARDPVAANLIRLPPGQVAGDWRDSTDGLGGGVFPYSVNAVLVPAALAALRMLEGVDELAPHLAALGALDELEAMVRVWQDAAPDCFLFARPAATLRAAVESYTAELRLPPAVAAAALADCGAAHECVASALALDAAGHPLPILHSDFAFALMFARPDAATLRREVAQLVRPFPAGLMTDAGMLVANPVYGDAALRERFANDRYHGTVVWSWQQALAAAGLARQLARDDLDAATRRVLADAQALLWQRIAAAREVANSELWSWDHDGSRFVVAPYGPKSRTADESNAA